VEAFHLTTRYVRPKLLILMRQPRRRRGSGSSNGLSTTIKYVRLTASGAVGSGRVAVGSGLSTSLSTSIKYVRRAASGAAGNDLGTATNFLRGARNGAAGNGLGTTAKYMWQTTAVLSAECFSPAATASRGRRKRSGHRPGHHDHVCATDATSNDSTSSKVHRRVCYLTSVHMRLAIFSLPLCSSAECPSPDAAALRCRRQRSKHRLENHDQVSATHSVRPRATASAP
jgi:hypothetical protein